MNGLLNVKDPPDKDVAFARTFAQFEYIRSGVNGDWPEHVFDILFNIFSLSLERNNPYITVIYMLWLRIRTT